MRMDAVFFLCRRTVSSSTDQSCSTPHASLIPLEMCISMRVWKGTSCACVQTGLCSVCRSNITTWAARPQKTHVEKLTRRLNWNLLLPSHYNLSPLKSHYKFCRTFCKAIYHYAHNNTSAAHLTCSVFLILCAKLCYRSSPLGQRY